MLLHATGGVISPLTKNILCISTIYNLVTSFQHIFVQTMIVIHVHKHYTGVHKVLNMLMISWELWNLHVYHIIFTHGDLPAPLFYVSLGTYNGQSDT